MKVKKRVKLREAYLQTVEKIIDNLILLGYPIYHIQIEPTFDYTLILRLRSIYDTGYQKSNEEDDGAKVLDSITINYIESKDPFKEISGFLKKSILTLDPEIEEKDILSFDIDRPDLYQKLSTENKFKVILEYALRQVETFMLSYYALSNDIKAIQNSISRRTV